MESKLPTSFSLGVDSAEDVGAFFEAVLMFGWRGALALQKPPKRNAFDRGLPEAGVPPPPCRWKS